MEYSPEIEKLAKKISKDEPTTFEKKINLYSGGISAKLLNADFALSNLKTLRDLPDNSSQSDNSELNVRDQIHFFTDTFFAFLYSAFDVSAQVINQKLRLGIDEKSVSIKRVKQKLKSKLPDHKLNSILDTLLKSRHFSNLDKYRNCSTHRRQIYIRTTAISISETPGYSTTGDLMQVVRYICDDPLKLNPTVNQNRELITYMEGLLKKVIQEIFKLLKNL